MPSEQARAKQALPAPSEPHSHPCKPLLPCSVVAWLGSPRSPLLGCIFRLLPRQAAVEVPCHQPSFCSHPVPSPKLELHPGQLDLECVQPPSADQPTPQPRGAPVEGWCGKRSGKSSQSKTTARFLRPQPHGRCLRRTPLPRAATAGSGENGVSQADSMGDTWEGSSHMAPGSHPPRVTPVSIGGRGDPARGCKTSSSSSASRAAPAPHMLDLEPSLETTPVARGDPITTPACPGQHPAPPWAWPKGPVGAQQGNYHRSPRPGQARAQGSGLPPQRHQPNTLICFAAGSLILQI